MNREIDGRNNLLGGYYDGVMNSRYLAHHGARGMKWGIRKYQNEDGSLTPTGKERYSSESKKPEVVKPSIGKRVKNFIEGKANGETDSTKVDDGKLRRQMARNVYQNTKLQDNWDFKGASAREERKLSKDFVKTHVKNFNRTDPESWKRANTAGQQYLREVAKLRLQSMGYDDSAKAVNNLISKKWFKDSLWLQNTLASMGVSGVSYPDKPKDDMIFK